MAFKTIQLLRNNSAITEKGTYADVHAAALAKLNEILGASTTLDGQPVLVRYKDGTSAERTILGIKGSTANEIFDNVAGNDAITTAITNLIGGASEDFNTLKEIEDVIKAMDKDANAENGKVVTTVSEDDGVVSETKANVKDLQLGGYSKDASATGDIASTDTINAALSKLENKSAATTVKSIDKTVKITNDNGKDLSVNIDGTTIVKDTNGTLSADLKLTKLTDDEITALHDANVKEAYKVIYSTDTNRTAIGDTVKIYKDQTLKSASFANQILTLTYILSDGSESPVNIDMSSLIEEQEVENGIQVNDHKLSIKLDTSGDDTGSGKFLTVGADGLKLDGVTDAINTAVAGLDADVAQTAGADGLALSITEVDGKITAISGSIAAETYDAHGAAATAKSEVIGASTDAKTADTIYGAKAYADDAATTAVDALNVSDAAVANQFVTSVSESKGKISVTRAQPAAAGVTVADSAEYFIATNVEGALAELAKFDCGTY